MQIPSFLSHNTGAPAARPYTISARRSDDYAFLRLREWNPD